MVRFGITPSVWFLIGLLVMLIDAPLAYVIGGIMIVLGVVQAILVEWFEF